MELYYSIRRTAASGWDGSVNIRSILDYQQVTRVQFTVWEVELLLDIDSEYMK